MVRHLQEEERRDKLPTVPQEDHGERPHRQHFGATSDWRTGCLLYDEAEGVQVGGPLGKPGKSLEQLLVI